MIFGMRIRRRGVAIVLVLGFIALLALLVTAVMETLRTRLVEGERFAQRNELRLDALSALEVAKARLAVFRMDGGGVYLNAADLESIAADPLAGCPAVSGGAVSLRLCDETGKFPLNTTDVRALRELFEDVGVPEDRAEALADALADWLDEDDEARLSGAESEAYATPGLPANRPLRRFAELRQVRGFAESFFEADGTPNESGRRLADIVTLLGADGKPNVNTANEAVLRVLTARTGGDPGSLMAFRVPLDYPNERRHPGVFESAGNLALVDAPPALGGRVSYASRRIRATVVVQKGDLRYVCEALLSPSPSTPKAPVVVKAQLDSGRFDDLDSK